MDTIEIRLAKQEDAQFIACLGEQHSLKHLDIYSNQNYLLDYIQFDFSVQNI